MIRTRQAYLLGACLLAFSALTGCVSKPNEQLSADAQDMLTSGVPS